MFRYILKRIILGFFTIFALLIIVYFLQATQGKNPIREAAIEKPPITPPGLSLNDVINEELRQNGFFDPVIVRFGKYVYNLFVNGDLGVIFSDRNLTPDQAFFGPLRFTILVTIPVFFISTIFGIIFGVIAAYNRGKLIDSLINVFTNIFVGLPAFIIAPIAIIIAVNIGLPPEFRRSEVASTTTTTIFLSLITPITVSVLSALSIYMIYTRNQMVTVLTSNHVLIAKTKGLSGRQIFFKHVLRNASLPVLGLIIPSFLGLLSSNILIEQFFGVPGSSTTIISFFTIGEIHVIMFNALFFSSAGQAISIFVDSLYVVVDPTIKFAKSRSSSNYFSFWLANLQRKVHKRWGDKKLISWALKNRYQSLKTVSAKTKESE